MHRLIRDALGKLYMLCPRGGSVSYHGQQVCPLCGQYVS